MKSAKYIIYLYVHTQLYTQLHNHIFVGTSRERAQKTTPNSLQGHKIAFTPTLTNQEAAYTTALVHTYTHIHIHSDFGWQKPTVAPAADKRLRLIAQSTTLAACIARRSCNKFKFENKPNSKSCNVHMYIHRKIQKKNVEKFN